MKILFRYHIHTGKLQQIFTQITDTCTYRPCRVMSLCRTVSINSVGTVWIKDQFWSEYLYTFSNYDIYETKNYIHDRPATLTFKISVRRSKIKLALDIDLMLISSWVVKCKKGWGNMLLCLWYTIWRHNYTQCDNDQKYCLIPLNQNMFDACDGLCWFQFC